MSSPVSVHNDGLVNSSSLDPVDPHSNVIVPRLRSDLPATTIVPSASTDTTPTDTTTTLSPQPSSTHQTPPHLDTPLDPLTHTTELGEAQPAQSEGEPMDQQQEIQVKTEGMEPSLGHATDTIHLVEHTPGTIALEEAVNMEPGEWTQVRDQMKRVKVYELIASRWVDQGTAFCYGEVKEDTGQAFLTARAERDMNDIILQTVIRSNDVYQRQQDTLIVWTEPDGIDYALSFQDPEGCAEVWNFITEVQQHMISVEDTTGLSSSPTLGSDTSVTTASIIRSGHLPQPALGIINEIERAIKALARTQSVKERICEYIQQEEYIKSLIRVMQTAEDLENLENLHALCSLMQTILMLNDHTLYEHILEDNLFFGVVGMLEYDPDFPSYKANYRDFLKQVTHFHQPIPIHDPIIEKKIHQTFRLQFLKDVVLARALDDSTFNVLNSYIIFNQMDIITHVQQDQTFLREIVKLFVDEDVLTGGARYQMQLQMMQQQQQQRLNQGPVVISLTSADQDEDAKGEVTKPEDSMDVDSPGPALPALTTTESSRPVNGLVNGRTSVPPNAITNVRIGAYSFAPPDDLSDAEIAHRREVILLIQQLCIMGKNVQLPARMALFRILVDRGILFAVQWAMGLPESVEINRQTIGAAGEVLSALLDHDLNGVRGHVLKQIMAIEKERNVGKKGADKAETLLEMTCRMMARSKDLGVQSLVGDALKVWMDIPSADVPTSMGEAAQGLAPKLAARKDDLGTERFLGYFYKDCLYILFKPLMELPEWKNCQDQILCLAREQANRYVYLCELLFNFIQQHHFRNSFYVVSSNILSRLATLLRAKDKHLRHASFRIFRLLLKQNNTLMHGQIIKHDILKPILDLTLQESRRDNLLSCSCQEYFESMRRDNMKDLIKECMTKHEDMIRKLAQTQLGGQRFELLIRRWEMNNEPLPEETKPEKPLDTRPRSLQGRFVDAEEENYFNQDDEDDGTVLPSISQQSQWARTVPSNSLSPKLASNPNVNTLKRRRVGGAKGHRPPLRTPSLRSLVDYGEDDDEDSVPADQGAENAMSADPLPKLAPSPILKTDDGAPGRPQLPPVKEEDEEDNMLEALVRGKAPPSESPTPTSPPRLGEKRRRGDDDDDELLSRLTKPKKQQVQQRQSKPINNSPIVSLSPATTQALDRRKNGGDPPKRMKLKLGGFGNALANAFGSAATGAIKTEPESRPASSPSHSAPSPSPSPAPSESGTKDGDTG